MYSINSLKMYGDTGNLKRVVAAAGRLIAVLRISFKDYSEYKTTISDKFNSLIHIYGDYSCYSLGDIPKAM